MKGRTSKEDRIAFLKMHMFEFDYEKLFKGFYDAEFKEYKDKDFTEEQTRLARLARPYFDYRELVGVRDILKSLYSVHKDVY